MQECDTQTNHIESSQKNNEFPNKSDNLSHQVPTIYFNDGMRSVDFVLVWDAFNENAATPEAYEKRKIFENNLLKEGLQLENVPQERNGLNFVKVKLNFTYFYGKRIF